MRRINAVQIMEAFNYDITKRPKENEIKKVKETEEKQESFSSIFDYECKKLSGK